MTTPLGPPPFTGILGTQLSLPSLVIPDYHQQVVPPPPGPPPAPFPDSVGGASGGSSTWTSSELMFGDRTQRLEEIMLLDVEVHEEIREKTVTQEWLPGIIDHVLARTEIKLEIVEELRAEGWQSADEIASLNLGSLDGEPWHEWVEPLKLTIQEAPSPWTLPKQETKAPAPAFGWVAPVPQAQDVMIELSPLVRWVIVGVSLAVVALGAYTLMWDARKKRLDRIAREGWAESRQKKHTLRARRVESRKKPDPAEAEHQRKRRLKRQRRRSVAL